MKDKIKFILYFLVFIIILLICLLLDANKIVPLVDTFGGIYQSIAAAVFYSFSATFISAYLSNPVRIKYALGNSLPDKRTTIVEEQTRVFDDLIKNDRARSIKDSLMLREKLESARKTYKYSIHMLPLNYQSIRYYNVREGKVWLDSEHKLTRGPFNHVIKRIYIVDFDEDDNEQYVYEEIRLTQKEAALKIYEILEPSCDSCFVRAQTMRDQGEIIRDYGLFFESEAELKIGFFAFKEIEQRFTKALSNHFYSEDPVYLSNIKREFDARWQKSFQSEDSKDILNSWSKAKP